MNGPVYRPVLSVAVAMSACNEALDRTLTSLQAQTYQDFEVLLVVPPMAYVQDGHSEFRSLRIRPLPVSTPALAQHRNGILDTCTGEFFCSLVVGDALDPMYFERAVAELQQDQGLALVSCGVRLNIEEPLIWCPTACDLITMLDSCTFCHATVVRKSAAIAVRGYDSGFSDLAYQSWDLYITLLESGFNGRVLPEILFHGTGQDEPMLVSYSPEHMRPDQLRRMVEKHRASYHAHLIDILLKRESSIRALLLANHEHEQLIALRRAVGPSLHPRSGA